jgi:type III pantothenate kinase
LSKKLIIDLGNTLQKLAVFDDKDLVSKEIFNALDAVKLQAFIDKHGPFRGIMQSSVVIHTREMEELLARAGRFIPLTFQTPIPFTNLYKTPATLGKDRIAAVAGAWSLHPQRNILIIDAGTCITYDFINEKAEYKGGAISPGIRMRFKAMHTFTGKLPLVEADNFEGFAGQTNRESMLAGVYTGVVAEIKEMIKLYEDKHADLLTIITGGDYLFLHTKLKNSIFAHPDLVLLGLNEIFDYNDQ